ncbi:MAG: hypothetical protein ACXWFZ_13895 [Nitrososphaeraceae archaeon]
MSLNFYMVRKKYCVICGKNWLFLEERGFSKIKSAFVAEKNISALTE